MASLRDRDPVGQNKKFTAQHFSDQRAGHRVDTGFPFYSGGKHGKATIRPGDSCLGWSSQSHGPLSRGAVGVMKLLKDCLLFLLWDLSAQRARGSTVPVPRRACSVLGVWPEMAVGGIWSLG